MLPSPAAVLHPKQETGSQPMAVTHPLGPAKEVVLERDSNKET